MSIKEILEKFEEKRAKALCNNPCAVPMLDQIIEKLKKQLASAH